MPLEDAQGKKDIVHHSHAPLWMFDVGLGSSCSFGSAARMLWAALNLAPDLGPSEK